MKLDKEKTKIWLKALRSGEYKQGIDALYTADDGVDKFCCLGVAIDVLFEGDWEWEYGEWNYQGMTAILPIELTAELGLSGEREGRLIGMNDKGGKTFAEIADVIEGWMNDEA